MVKNRIKGFVFVLKCRKKNAIMIAKREFVDMNCLRKEVRRMIILMLLSVVCASVYSCILNRTGVREKNEVFKFNLICSAVWFLILTAANGGISVNGDVFFWGILYGVIQSLFILFKTEAMSTGAVSVTTLIGNSSLLISILFCFVAWNERPSAWDIVGLAMLCAAIFLCTYNAEEEKHSLGKKHVVILFLIFAAGVGIVFKAFGKSEAANRGGDMMAVSACVMMIFYLAASFFPGKGNERIACGSVGRFCFAAITSGVLSCAYNRLNVYLSARLDGILFFPFFNGGTVLLSTILGMCLCGERPGKKRLAGIFIGTAAIAVIGVF